MNMNYELIPLIILAIVLFGLLHRIASILKERNSLIMELEKMGHLHAAEMKVLESHINDYNDRKPVSVKSAGIVEATMDQDSMSLVFYPTSEKGFYETYEKALDQVVSIFIEDLKNLHNLQSIGRNQIAISEPVKMSGGRFSIELKFQPGHDLKSMPVSGRA